MDNSRNRDDGKEHIADSAAGLYPPAMSKGKGKGDKEKERGKRGRRKRKE